VLNPATPDLSNQPFGLRAIFCYRYGAGAGRRLRAQFLPRNEWRNGSSLGRWHGSAGLNPLAGVFNTMARAHYAGISQFFWHGGEAQPGQRPSNRQMATQHARRWFEFLKLTAKGRLCAIYPAISRKPQALTLCCDAGISRHWRLAAWGTPERPVEQQHAQFGIRAIRPGGCLSDFSQ